MTAVERLTDPVAAAEYFGPITQVRGPALLFYGRPMSTTTTQHEVVGPVPVDDDRVCALLQDTSVEDREEAALEATTSGIYLALDGSGAPGAGCGWREWPNRIGHVAVISARAHRREGYAFSAAHAALSAAAGSGLLPQWRAALGNSGSVALATRLGLHLAGRQMSVELATTNE